MLKGINPASKCYGDVYSAKEVDEKFDNWSGLSSESIPSNADLNNYKTVGFFRCRATSIAQTVGNTPTVSPFTLLVELHAADGVKQTVTRHTLTSPSTWVRSCYNGEWGAWTKLNSTLEDPQIYSGTSTPSSSLGKNGDVYFLYE